MLNKIRNDLSHNKAIRTGLIVLVVGFVFWGMGLENLSFNKNYAIKAGSAEVSANEYFRAYQNAKQQVLTQFGGQEVPAELLKLFGIEKNVTQQLSTGALLENYALKNDIIIDEKLVFELIKKEVAFHKDGKFDKQTYVATLRQAQLSPLEFEENVAKQLQINLLANYFNDTIEVSANELDMRAKFLQERRDIEVLTITAKDITTLPTATTEELEEIYQENIENFKVAEKRDFQVLTVSKEALAKEINVSDDDAKAYYDENKDEFFTKPEFRVKQILVADEATADKILALTDLTENFDKFVIEYSTDKHSKDKKGDLGWLSANIFGAEFENMVHSTNKGEVAKTAIKTPFGFHIFKLADVKEAKQKAFNTIKENIKADLASKQADELLTTNLNTALDMAAAGEKLENIAKELNFTVQDFKDATADSPQSYINVVFETNEGEISQPVDLEFEATALIQVSKITNETSKELEEVKDEVVSIFNEQKTKELKSKLASEALAHATTGELSFKDVAKKLKLTSPVKSVVSLARENNQAKNIDNNVAAQVFKSETNKVINNAISTEKEILIVKVENSYQEKISAKDLENVKKELTMEKTNDLYSSFLTNLTKSYSVEVNQKVIDYVIKQN